MRISCLLSLLFLLETLRLPAQSTLSGLVLTTGGDTVIGANVLLEGTYDGATTGPGGTFSFQSSEQGPQTLIVLYVGCDTLRQRIVLTDNKLNLHLRLKESAALHEVVISAGAFEAASDRRRAVVLSPVDIALTASATADIAGAISTLPGAVRNGESGQILVRGGAGYETRTFIDGLYVQNPYNSSVPNVPARNRFSPFLFKGTLFSTGGYSAEYGQALSSALILQSQDLAPQTNTGLSLMSVGAALSHTQRWENTSVSLSGNFMNLAPYFALAPQRIDWITPPQAGGGELIFRHRTQADGMFKFYGSANRSVFRMNYPDSFDPEQTNPLALHADNFYGNASYRGMLRSWVLFAGAAFTWNRDAMSSAFENNKTLQSGQARFSLARPLGASVRLKFGGEYGWGRYREFYRDDAPVEFDILRKEHYAAAFAESDLFFSKKIVARVGLRAERSALLQKSKVAPRLSAAWNLRAGEQIAAAFGRFYQTPEYELLRRNTDLDFENATHYMLNYQRIRDGFTFRAEGYYKTYDRLVKIEPATGFSNNRGSGYARGIDLFFRDQKTIKHGDYWISYSYLNTERDYRDFPGPAVPAFAAAHQVSVVYKHWFSKINTAFGATYVFQSGRPYDQPGSERFNSGRTPAYHDLSVNASYLTNLGGHFTILYVSATNLLGFEQVYGYRFGAQPGPDGQFAASPITPPAKRFVFAGLFISFGKRYKSGETTRDDI